MVSVRDPLIIPFVFFAFGLVCASRNWAGPQAAALSTGAFGLLFLAARWKRASRGARLAGWCLAASLGAGAYHLHQPSTLPKLDAQPGETVLLSGCVVEPSVADGDRLRFVLELAPRARARVSIPAGLNQPLPYGARVEGVARLLEPREFQNPGAFSYGAWLERRSIFWLASAPQGTVWTRTEGECGRRFVSILTRLRQHLLERIDALYGSDTYHAAMMRGLLLGEDSAIERVWVEDFRRTGTYHALVISGGHIAFFTGLFLLWFRLSGKGRGLVLALATLVAWAYSLLAGGDAPVLRSAAGFTLFAVTRLVYRRSRLLNLLALVAFGFLLVDPTQIFEASFQLSFLAVAAIGAFADPLAKRYLQPYGGVLRGLAQHRYDARMDPRAAALRVELRLLIRTIHLWTRLPESWLTGFIGGGWRAGYWVAGVLLVSASVQIALALPMMFYFHRLSWTGLLANVIVTPLATFAIPLGFLAIGTGGGLFSSGAALLLDAARLAAAWHAGWEFPFRVPDPPVWLVAGIAVCLALSAWAIRRSSPLWPVPAVMAHALIALAALSPFPPRIERGALELTAIDVGMGESLFLGLPDGKAMVIDGGGLPSPPGRRSRFDIGEDVVAPYLWSRGVRRLDVLAVTHFHHDHAGGIPALLDAFRPAEFWIGPDDGSARARRLIALARDAGASVRVLRAGDRFRRNGVSWHAVSPDDAAAGSANNASLVLHARYGRHSALLAGDIERPVENRLLAAATLPAATILKVAHHGSRTASSPGFVSRVAPVVGIISAGRANTFRFPHPEVLRTLQEQRVYVGRTDRDGAVGVVTDGRFLEMRYEITASRRLHPWSTPPPP